MMESPERGPLLNCLDRADTLSRDGRLTDAVELLETALERVRETPYRVPFFERLELGMALTDLYLIIDRRGRAQSLLTVEAAFADQIWQLFQRSGTRDQIRDAAAGRTQVADRAAQVALIGQPAPEIEVAEWVLGQPTTCAQLRGRVVLLEFWAYSCRPCLTAFPLSNGLRGHRLHHRRPHAAGLPQAERR
jgi:thiol-disulfide isomerase/thioredoxin